MKISAKDFRDSPNKAITLLGMSGVGKTTFASKLPKSSWYHYSGDYRIGTKYLDEPILDEVKKQAMGSPFVRDLLLSDSIYIRNNITIDHLHPISCFLGKIGNPELGGLSVEEFKRRQNLFWTAEIDAMQDIRPFIAKARRIYGYPHFVNDAGGSICSLNDEQCWDTLSELTVILYLRASEEMEQTLLERALEKPKPLHYTEDFLDRNLGEYLEENNMDSAGEIVPDQFVQWMFPRLLAYRKPLYEHLTDRYGYTIDAQKIPELRDERDLIDLVCESIDRQTE